MCVVNATGVQHKPGSPPCWLSRPSSIADLAYLQGLSSAIVEHILHATGHLYYPCGTSIAEKMLDEISLTTLRDIANVMSPNERIAMLRSVS